MTFRMYSPPTLSGLNPGPWEGEVARESESELLESSSSEVGTLFWMWKESRREERDSERRSDILENNDFLNVEM